MRNFTIAEKAHRISESVQILDSDGDFYSNFELLISIILQLAADFSAI